jgi:hypothetical protein
MAGEGLTLPGIRRILLLEAEVADLRRQIVELQAATGSTNTHDSSLRRRRNKHHDPPPAPAGQL